MKNILKKLGLIAIIVGVLSPFITLPNVKAATSNSCRYYLNQYLFYDVSYPSGFSNYTDNSGYTTYTSFIYDYPTITSNQQIIVEKAVELEINTNELLQEFHGNVIKLTTGTEEEISNIEKMGTLITNNINQTDISTHLHGYWNKENDDSREEAGWEINNSVDAFTDEETIQGRMINGSDRDIDDLDLQVSFGGATYNSYRNVFGYASGYNSIENFVSSVVTDVATGGSNAINNNYVYEETDNGVTTKYINFRINRKLDEYDLNELVFGYETTVGNFVAYSKNKEEVNNSFEALIEYETYNKNGQDENGDKNFCNDGNSSNKECYLVPIGSEEIDYFTNKPYYWPAVLQVEYKVCNTDGTPVGDKKWTLTYDRGVSGDDVVKVTNMPEPNPATELTGTSVTLSTTKPKREGYEFKSWCTDNDGKGTCVEAGKEFKNEKMEDDILYAYWVKPGTEDSEKTGVISYVIGFIGVGLIAYGLYYVINKKNLFKQI